MTQRKPQFVFITLPAMTWLRRAFQLVLVAAGLMLLSLSKAGNPAAVKLRANVLDIVTPVMTVVASPFDSLMAAGQWMNDFADTRAQNISLKNENLRLLEWQATAKRLEAENQSLKSLMSVVPARKGSYVTAKMVADVATPFSQSALINAGAAQGVKADQAVINEAGLIGRVMEVGENSARVLLLSDVNSRVPVVTEKSRQKSILTGSNAALPILSYLLPEHNVAIGERIVTSGDGGIFPAGVPVGVVAAIDGDIVSVQPFADIARVEYISIIDYKF